MDYICADCPRMCYAIRGDWAMVSRCGSDTLYCALGIAVGMSIVLAVEFTVRKLTDRKH